jgi:hypothetical protein
VAGATPEQAVQARAFVAATRAVTGASLKSGTISFEHVNGSLGDHISGLAACPVVYVLVDPALGFGPDLRSTALAHELCHCAGYPQATADACAALVMKALP